MDEVYRDSGYIFHVLDYEFRLEIHSLVAAVKNPKETVVAKEPHHQPARPSEADSKSHCTGNCVARVIESTENKTTRVNSGHLER